MSAELLSYLEKIIAFETVNGRPEEKAACLEWIAGTFLSDDAERLIRGSINENPYLYLQNPDSRMLWFAHLDVVPGQPEQFSIQTDGDRVYGRGTKDMKGAALTLLLAYVKAKQAGLADRVSLLFTTDEEISGQTIPTLLKEKVVSASIAYTPDNGTVDHIVTAHKGAAWAKLTVRGKGTHSAMPWAGENPIPQLAHCITVLADHFPSGKSNEWRMTVTPTRLIGSDAANKIPDAAICHLDIRYPPEECASAKQALEKVSAVLPGDCSLEVISSAQSLATNPAHPVVLAFQNTAQAVTGRTIEIGRDHGATDARFFGEAGIPAFIYGPIGGDLHGAEEWVSQQSLIDLTNIQFQMLQQI